MRPGSLIYQCRRCGDLDKNMHAPNILVALHEIQVHGRVVSWQPGMAASKDSIHTCSDGHLGWCDLVGGQFDPPESA